MPFRKQTSFQLVYDLSIKSIRRVFPNEAIQSSGLIFLKAFTRILLSLPFQNEQQHTARSVQYLRKDLLQELKTGNHRELRTFGE